MTPKEAEDLCARWLPAWTGNRPDSLVAFYTDDVFYRDPARPNGVTGREDLLAYFRKLLARNPDWRWSALEIAPTEKGFTLKWEASIPVGERTVREVGLDIVEVRGDLIRRNEVFFDPSRLR